jgi:hypothetical protein
VFATSGGAGTVPKYTSYEVAPADAAQIRAGVRETPVAPLAGNIGAGVDSRGAWFTVNVDPAAVRVPVREEEPGFESTLKFTDPLPKPLEPEVIVSHESLEKACQPHPAEVVMEVEPVAALAERETFEGDNENVHAVGTMFIASVSSAISDPPPVTITVL